LPRGLYNAPQGGSADTDYIRTIKLAEDGESSRIRFLTDVDEIYFEYQHPVGEGRTFKGFKPCLSAAFEQACDFCDNGIKAQLQFFAWVYEYYHDYTVKGDGREAIKQGRRTVYREEVNGVKLLRAAGGHKAGILLRADRDETLLERDYDWVRLGEKGSTETKYLLEPSDEGKTPMPKELAALAATLPDLEDVALDRVESLDGKAKVEKKAKKKEDTRAQWEIDDEKDKKARKEKLTIKIEEDGDDDPAPFSF
jgi:hypothetical protein